jgi:Leucine-rich repeat (LRR) protein
MLVLPQNLATLQQLTTVTSLVRLNVSFNCLTHLRGIGALTNLQQLDLGQNSLTQLEPTLTALTNLSQLVCSRNKISSTEVVAQLPSLQFLALHNNSISTAADVLSLSQLTELKYLSLCNNPVCKQDNWQHATIALLPNLQVSHSTTSAVACMWPVRSIYNGTHMGCN